MTARKLFLSVGAMKAGTTFLFNAFSRHPDLYFTPEKELHFFAQTDGLSSELTKPLESQLFARLRGLSFQPGDILSNDFRRHRLSMVMHNRFSKLQNADEVRRIVCWYSDRYMTNPIDDGWFDRVFEQAGDRYACDFSNYHALLGADGWKHAKSVSDELKVIYTLRHPVKRLWSHIKFDFIQSGRRDALQNFGMKELDDVLANGGISAHARYGDIAESLMANVNAQDLKILPFENFTRNFESSAQEVEEFLGISKSSYPHVDTKRKSNATEDISIPTDMVERIHEVVRPQLEKLKLLGVEVPESYWN